MEVCDAAESRRTCSVPGCALEPVPLAAVAGRPRASAGLWWPDRAGQELLLRAYGAQFEARAPHRRRSRFLQPSAEPERDSALRCSRSLTSAERQPWLTFKFLRIARCTTREPSSSGGLPPAKRTAFGFTYKGPRARNRSAFTVDRRSSC